MKFDETKKPFFPCLAFVYRCFCFSEHSCLHVDWTWNSRHKFMLGLWRWRESLLRVLDGNWVSIFPYFFLLTFVFCLFLGKNFRSSTSSIALHLCFFFREMCLWDLEDGRCVIHRTNSRFIHTSIQVRTRKLLWQKLCIGETVLLYVSGDPWRVWKSEKLFCLVCSYWAYVKENFDPSRALDFIWLQMLLWMTQEWCLHVVDLKCALNV